MSDPRPQSFATHRSIPKEYLAVGVILTANMLVSFWYLIQIPQFSTAWDVLVSASLIYLWFTVRRYTLTVQDRIIRLEMRLRLERVLGPGREADIARLTPGQLVALRFASDAELPALVNAVLNKEMGKQDEIKKRITDWQADWLRI